LFKQETQINFSKYLMDYRVEEAKKLLRDTNLHIYEVAERVGFPNPYYFSKVFKEATGVSCKHYQSDFFP
ncbi:MAG: helix-turn-helix transcriptional regulator, partial [Clostridia bacterium]